MYERANATIRQVGMLLATVVALSGEVLGYLIVRLCNAVCTINSESPSDAVYLFDWIDALAELHGRRLEKRAISL
ncbi:hypothetical protein DFP73DRAFT_38402 [Morchella snyderi]|nr:hypothetical protein DFP73DRAFT_38402 [Morchella snyderi]